MNNDREEILIFLSQTRETLAFVMENGMQYLPETLYSEMREPYSEISDKFEDIRKDIEVRWDDIEDELEERGLTGRHLRYKLRGFQDALERWAGRPIKRLILSVLGWINVILGSLVSVVAGVEIVKEFKEALEQGIDDGLQDLNMVS